MSDKPVSPVKVAWDDYQAIAAKYGPGAPETTKAHARYARALTAAKRRRNQP